MTNRNAGFLTQLLGLLKVLDELAGPLRCEMWCNLAGILYSARMDAGVFQHGGYDLSALLQIIQQLSIFCAIN